jgi:metal-sulfur cluster biosynthetic enzyme
MTVLIPTLDPDVCACLGEVIDPELGVNIVDLGLVLAATRTAGAIEVAFTLTSRACPLGSLISDEVTEALRAAFPDAGSIVAQLVWDPPWSHEMVTDRGFELLGMKRTGTLA